MENNEAQKPAEEVVTNKPKRTRKAKSDSAAKAKKGEVKPEVKEVEVIKEVEVVKEVEVIKEVEVVKVVTPQIFLQFDGIEIDATKLVEQAQASCNAASNCQVESIRLYLKPADGAAYYVVNEVETGKIDLK